MAISGQAVCTVQRHSRGRISDAMSTDGGEFWYLPMDVVRYGPGSLAHLPLEVRRLGAQRAFVVTGHSVATRTGILARVRELLGQALAGTFTGARQHAPYASVQQALDEARAAKADLL